MLALLSLLKMFFLCLHVVAKGSHVIQHIIWFISKCQQVGATFSDPVLLVFISPPIYIYLLLSLVCHLHSGFTLSKSHSSHIHIWHMTKVITMNNNEPGDIKSDLSVCVPCPPLRSQFTLEYSRFVSTFAISYLWIWFPSWCRSALGALDHLPASRKET